ncbi:MAG: hypothetical protein OXH53_04240 [bacterium]|nr:hypothetical protein [bacterium]
MSTEPQGSDHNENEVRMPKVLPSITVNRGLIPDSWGIWADCAEGKQKIGDLPRPAKARPSSAVHVLEG